jgi:hypothetical protein
MQLTVKPASSSVPGVLALVAALATLISVCIPASTASAAGLKGRIWAGYACLTAAEAAQKNVTEAPAYQYTKGGPAEWEKGICQPEGKEYHVYTAWYKTNVYHCGTLQTDDVINSTAGVPLWRVTVEQAVCFDGTNVYMDRLPNVKTFVFEGVDLTVGDPNCPITGTGEANKRPDHVMTVCKYPVATTASWSVTVGAPFFTVQKTFGPQPKNVYHEIKIKPNGCAYLSELNRPEGICISGTPRS